MAVAAPVVAAGKTMSQWGTANVGERFLCGGPARADLGEDLLHATPQLWVVRELGVDALHDLAGAQASAVG